MHEENRAIIALKPTFYLNVPRVACLAMAKNTVTNGVMSKICLHSVRDRSGRVDVRDWGWFFFFFFFLGGGGGIATKHMRGCIP